MLFWQCLLIHSLLQRQNTQKGLTVCWLRGSVFCSQTWALQNSQLAAPTWDQSSPANPDCLWLCFTRWDPSSDDPAEPELRKKMPDLVSWWWRYLHGSFRFPVSSGSFSLTWVLALVYCMCSVREEGAKRCMTWFSTWMSYQRARAGSESNPCWPPVGLREEIPLRFMEYVKSKFVHKLHSLPTSPHCWHHELFSHAAGVVQVSVILLWKCGVDS